MPFVAGSWFVVAIVVVRCPVLAMLGVLLHLGVIDAPTLRRRDMALAVVCVPQIRGRLADDGHAVIPRKIDQSIRRHPQRGGRWPPGDPLAPHGIEPARSSPPPP